MLGGDAYPAAPDGRRHRIHSLVLPHDMLLQPHIQLRQTLELLFLDLAGGDLGPHLDDPCDVLHGHLRHTLLLQLCQFLLQAHLLAPQLCNAGIALIQLLLRQLLPFRGLGRHEGLPLEGHVLQIPLHLHPAVDGRILQVQIRAGLVDEVDGLVRQEPVGDIPLRQQHRLPQHALRDGHPVVRLIVVGDTLEDLQRVLDAGLRHRHRLEAPLQRRILLDILAVFVEGGGSDDLNLPTGQGGLEDVGGVHAALGISGPYDVVYLVDDQNHVAQLADLLDEPLHAALELSTELGTGHQSRQIQQIDLLVPQLEGDLPGGDALGQSFGNGGLAHAGFTDEAGIVLLPAVQNLHHPLDLLLPADDGVQLALSGPAAEVDAVVIQIFVLLLALAGLLAGLPLRGLSLLCRGIVVAAEEPVQEGEGGGLSALLILVAVLVGLRHVPQLLGAAEGLHHLAVEILQIVRGNAHALHHVLHLRQAQLGGTLQAEALVDRLSLFIHP